MTKQDLLTHADEIEQQIAELMSQGKDGSYLEYLHHKANACRARAVEAREEEQAERERGDSGGESSLSSPSPMQNRPTFTLVQRVLYATGAAWWREDTVH
jgi:hypothetical protein